MITAEQFAEWKEHPVTKEVFSEIKKAMEGLKEKLVEGQTISNGAEATHGLTSRLVGQIDGLNQLLEITFADEKESGSVNEVSGY